MLVGLIDEEDALIIFHKIIVPSPRKHACQQRSVHITKRAAQDQVLCAADVERYDIVGLGCTIRLCRLVGEFLFSILQLLLSLFEGILPGTYLLFSSLAAILVLVRP